MKGYMKSSRKWLNPKGHWDTGAIQWEVRTSGTIHVIEGNLSIWDCGRKITLNFSAYNPQDLKQRARKLELLISELEEFREAMGKAYETIDWADPEDYSNIVKELYTDESE